MWFAVKAPLARCGAAAGPTRSSQRLALASSLAIPNSPVESDGMQISQLQLALHLIRQISLHRGSSLLRTLNLLSIGQGLR